MASSVEGRRKLSLIETVRAGVPVPEAAALSFIQKMQEYSSFFTSIERTGEGVSMIEQVRTAKTDKQQ